MVSVNMTSVAMVIDQRPNVLHRAGVIHSSRRVHDDPLLSIRNVMKNRSLVVLVCIEAVTLLVVQTGLAVSPHAKNARDGMVVHQSGLVDPVGWVIDIERGFVGVDAATEEEKPRGQEEGSGHPTDVESLSQLPALGVNQQRVIEVTDYGVSRPGDWDEHTDRGQ
jgi:hypothetical protein